MGLKSRVRGGGLFERFAALHLLKENTKGGGGGALQNGNLRSRRLFCRQVLRTIWVFPTTRVPLFVPQID